MSEYILVEPTEEHRGGFAHWCIAQNPEVRTASHSSFNVPAGLFQSVPGHLLDGALVDGFLYSHVVEEEKPVPTETAPRTRTRRASQ